MFCAKNSPYTTPGTLGSGQTGTIPCSSRRAVSLWINCYHAAGALGVPVMPFGGYKQSGIGREPGLEGMEGFLETKSVSIKLN